ncbi:hypothetical protein [Sphingobium herbicidovorans]|uniref:hypothetical protein n=1 Tax=Sphingobium herbicidovorans TaxID=76947 RepID=UPI0012E7120C|nr:hypothetical protein [Sphingobium herbicidovorans]
MRGPGLSSDRHPARRPGNGRQPNHALNSCRWKVAALAAMALALLAMLWHLARSQWFWVMVNAILQGELGR